MTDPVRQLPKAYLRMDPNLDQTHPDPGAMVRLLCAANRQPRRGRFKSRELIATILGKTLAAWLIAHHDVTQQDDGLWYVEGWDEWQEGDWTVGERQRRIRARRNGSVTPPLPDRDTSVVSALPDPLPDRNAPSEAYRREDVETEDVVRKKATLSPQAHARGNGGLSNEPRLTKRQLDSWDSFTAKEWDPFKAAWMDRGFLYAPHGSPDDDDTSQRGLLWQIADAQPHNLARWVREAPPGTAREVLDYVLQQWHEIREEAGVEDEEWADTKAEERRSAKSNWHRVGDVLGAMR